MNRRPIAIILEIIIYFLAFQIQYNIIMYKLVMRGEGGQKEEFRKRMEVGQLIHQTVFTPQIISDIKTFI